MDQNAHVPCAALASRIRALAALVLLAGSALGAWAQASNPLTPELLNYVQRLALAGARAGAPEQARVDIQLGQLDARLRLAPCRQVQPYLPQGQKMWGKSRIGLRCLDGAQGGARWNVSLPVTVQVYARAVVASQALAAGTLLTQELLQSAEVDIAAEAGQVFTDAGQLDGRSLQRPLVPGEAVRSSDLKARRWFAVGERVQVLASGTGYAIASEGQALEPGLEGQEVRVRFENGRTVTGRAVGERRVEVLL
ncbi:flagellar basal body P-ring formation protein FlgA [Roseateles sp. DAIF2]|uniref:flagellar basal body P-ring formation chaperone FlgA n=1 Tax=Roseateles sp. DAIF2 TaxID=2714952 RepID=UPI0018A2C3FE|nr:flagellar basal body P-ring formation chaperone FlgA [Roseateles sp. DAIF2]QPF73156.1 flagellar basal body P-ring formation protein FlgA [Roseateles sp. DAIF2]